MLFFILLNLENEELRVRRSLDGASGSPLVVPAIIGISALLAVIG